MLLSGDHRGSESLRGPCVSWNGTAPGAVEHTQMLERETRTGLLATHNELVSMT